MIFDEPTAPATDSPALKSDEARGIAGTPRKPNRKRKRLKRIAFGALIFALGGWLIGALFLRSWIAKPPPIPANASILQLKTEERDGRIWLGQSWVGRREGLLTVYLKGDPF